MTKRKVPVHVIFTGIYLLLALSTLIPTQTASKICLLGYKAHCTFSPISTVILLALGGLHIFLHQRTLAKKTEENS
jgi:hypothetical protein